MINCIFSTDSCSQSRVNRKNILYLLIDNYIYMAVKQRKDTHLDHCVTLCNSFDKMYKPHHFKKNFSQLDRQDKVV